MQLKSVRNVLPEPLFVKEDYCQNQKASQNQLLSLEHFLYRGEMEEKNCFFQYMQDKIF